MPATVLFALLCCGNASLEDGALLALHDSNKIVAHYTDSPITHLAIVVRIAGNPWVYEATPALVRRVPLSDYYREIGELNARRSDPIQVWVYRPLQPYAPAQIACMKAFLDSQLGRRYSVKQYLRRQPGEGIHCADLASTTLTRSGRFTFKNGHLESPASLIVKVKRWYKPPVSAPIKPLPATDAWCTRRWKAWSALYAWCSWACYESWSYCW